MYDWMMKQYPPPMKIITCFLLCGNQGCLEYISVYRCIVYDKVIFQIYTYVMVFVKVGSAQPAQPCFIIPLLPCLNCTGARLFVEDFVSFLVF